jgi:hypothetical protein
MGIKWCDWFSRWENGGRGGRIPMCGSGGLCCWYGCRHTWYWSALGFVASLLYILLSGRNQGGHWYGTARAQDLWCYCWVWRAHGCNLRCEYNSACVGFWMELYTCRHLVAGCACDIV